MQKHLDLNGQPNSLCTWSGPLISINSMQPEKNKSKAKLIGKIHFFAFVVALLQKNFCICRDNALIHLRWKCCEGIANLDPMKKCITCFWYIETIQQKKDFLASPSNFCFHETFNTYIGCCSDLIYLRLGWVNLSMFYILLKRNSLMRGLGFFFRRYS